MSDVYYKAKMWPESIKLASYYMGRSDYSFGNNPFLRQDLSYAQPQGYKEMVEKYAHEQGLSPALLFALLRVESAFDANAVSGAGAQGLAQLMKDTARDMAQRYQRTQRLSGSGGGSHSLQKLNLLDPDTSIHLGAYYLRYLEEHNSSTMLALLAYNGGMGRVRKWQAAARDIESDLFIETINIDETRNYGKQVLSCAAVYGWLYYGLSMEEVAADIYREE
jgi:soluble lytic murein transglycosylase